MSRRLLPTAALLAAFALLAGTALAAKAVHPRAGTYAGHTGNHTKIAIAVKRGAHKVRSISVAFGPCGSHRALHTFRGPWVSNHIRKGKLEAHMLKGDWALDLSGTFSSATRVSGTWQAVGPGLCFAGGSFHAKK